MTVKELVDFLKELPQDTTVKFAQSNGVTANKVTVKYTADQGDRIVIIAPAKVKEEV